MSDYLDDAPVGAVAKEGELASPVDVISVALKSFMDNIGPYALGGLGLMLIVIVAVIVMYAVMIACMFGGMMGMAGTVAALGEDAGAPLGMLVFFGAYVGMLLLLVVMGSVLSPVQGSLMRGIDDSLAGDTESLGFGSAFNTVMKQPMKEIVGRFVVTMLILLGLPVFYVGALVIAFFIGFAPLMIILDGESVGSALKKSFNHTKSNLTWHLGTFGLQMAVGMVAGSIPVLGPMAALAFAVASYREAFPRQDVDESVAA